MKIGEYDQIDSDATNPEVAVGQRNHSDHYGDRVVDAPHLLCHRTSAQHRSGHQQARYRASDDKDHNDVNK